MIKLTKEQKLENLREMKAILLLKESNIKAQLDGIERKMKKIQNSNNTNQQARISETKQKQIAKIRSSKGF